MRYLDYLEKAAVGDYNLYHATELYKLYSILSTNSLRLSLSESNSSEAILGTPKLYYMSFARTPASGYIADRGKSLRPVNESALIVFDRNKLLRKKGVIVKPVQYYNLDKDGRIFGSQGREAEERLFSNNLEIKGIISTIKEIRIMTFDDKYPVPRISKKLLLLIKTNKLKLKLFTMDNFQGFLLGKEKPNDRALALNNLKTSKYTINTYSSEARRAKQITKKNPNWRSYLDNLNEYVYKSSKDELTNKAKSSLYYHTRYPESFMEAYSAELHNMRSGIFMDKDRFDRLLKRMKAKTVKDFFNKLYLKWKDQ